MVQLDKTGVSDIVVVVFLFLFLVVTVTLLFGYNTNPLKASNNRRVEMQRINLAGTLRHSEPRPGIGALEASAEQLILKDPRVENEYLHSWMENVLEFLSPSRKGAALEMSLEMDNGGTVSWIASYPENANFGESIPSEGGVTVVEAGGNVRVASYKIWIFEKSENNL